MQPRETSLEAFERIKPDAKRLRESIYGVIARAGDRGMTCDEVEVELSLAHQTASARIYELHKANRIVEKDGPLCRRPTRTGSPAIVWVAPSQLTLPLINKTERKQSHVQH